MKRYCRQRSCKFHILWNDPLFALEPTSETYTTENEEPMIKSILDFNNRQMYKL